MTLARKPDAPRPDIGRRLAIALIALGLLFAGLALPARAQDLRVGSKRFTESYILAQIVAQSAQEAGTRVEVLQGLGNTAIVYAALRAGQIDAYVDYTGTVALEILHGPATMSLADMRAALAPLGLGIGTRFGFNDGYALAVRADDAERLGLHRLSDLAARPALRYGLSNEFLGRADGWPGLARRYGLGATPRGLDHGLAYEAIAQRQIDVMDIYTTDAKIAQLGLRVLADDAGYFPRYDAVLLYRLDVAQRAPRAWAAWQALEGRIGEAAMIAMNAQAELQGRPFERIAADFLRGTTVPAARSAGSAPAAAHSFTARLWQRLVAPDLVRLTARHLWLVLVAVGVAGLIAVPAGVLIFPHPRLRGFVLGAAGLLQTVPSLALLALLIALFGTIGAGPAIVALMLYALLPILSNTCAGLAEVALGLRLAATALGMTAGQRLRWIELPLALPTIVVGVRTASAIAIGTATIAAFIGAGGLGERIVTGLALNDSALMLAGALPSAALALLSELMFELWGRRLRPPS